MNTNQVEQIVQAANANGFHLTGEQVGIVLTIATFIGRYLTLELKVIIANGGIKGIWQKLLNGNKTTTNQDQQQIKP